MQKLRALNAKEKKVLYKLLEEQFGHTKLLNYIWLENTQEKIYLLSQEYAKLELEGLRVNNKGMYFGKKEKDGFRLSMEGAGMLSPTKNVLSLSKEQAELWMLGEDIPWEGHAGYVILKHGNDILGCTAHKNDIIRNMVPKERRLHSVTATQQ
jgi:NOL1/NOP2/fmu family ribosome biogenesis protein